MDLRKWGWSAVLVQLWFQASHNLHPRRTNRLCISGAKRFAFHNATKPRVAWVRCTTMQLLSRSRAICPSHIRKVRSHLSRTFLLPRKLVTMEACGMDLHHVPKNLPETSTSDRSCVGRWRSCCMDSYEFLVTYDKLMKREATATIFRSLRLQWISA